ncbi:MAG: bifunctional DNA-formamidopyrimidine glycosylase/DNA-(apurinic or apyrimidinic site) lyase [Candidatus Heimdallarchaeota archaeon]|nr:MAG: bifunctional DNA-formamidopyrimidine glycosylase/DNA-(apurinic or apyrimidinic site) lyase [Candidatus Heimdallarchaeota archaeon]
MPEGPEVENVRQELLQLVSKQVEQIRLTPLSQKYPKYQDKQALFTQFNEKVLTEIVRFGKFLVWRFKDINAVILNHLGMTGRWCFFSDIKNLPASAKHVKIIIQMYTPPSAIFDDTRNFGQFRVFESFETVVNYPPIRQLGIDGLTSPFPLEEFLTRLEKKNFENQPVGEVLLNQRLVAGVGNIYKTESLFHAKINPNRIVRTLSDTEREELGLAIGEILQKALLDKGSTLNFQPYELPSGERGNAQSWHKVYNREGKPCLICENPIRRSVQKGRSTFYCSQCQKKS